MKYVQLFAVAAMVFAMSGCGGSGGSSSSSPTAVITSTPRVEAIVLYPTTYDSGTTATGATYTYYIQDPRDIETQDQVQFQLVNYTTSGSTVTRNIIQTGYWVSSDSSKTYGTLAPDTGVYTAGTSQTTGNLTATTYYGGNRYSTIYRILPRQVRLRGQLLSDAGSNPPLAGVEIDFYGLSDPSNPASGLVQEGVVSTAYDGTFRASIPVTVTNFQINNASIPAGYQRFFRFGGDTNYYQTGILSCLAPLPTYTVGERFLIDYTNPDLGSNGTILLLSNQEALPTVVPGCTLQ